MRWRFESHANRQETLEKIGTFWEAFTYSSGALNDTFSGAGDFDVVAFMSTYFHPIHPEMMWEFGPALHREGHRLIVSPEYEYQLTELARTIVAEAPELEPWEFYVHRRPQSLETAQGNIASRTGGDISDATFELKVGDANLIDVSYTSRSSSRVHDAFLAIEALLGESVLYTWIGDVSAKKPKRFGTQATPLATLKDQFESVRLQTLSTLPQRPYVDWLTEDSEISLLSLEPQPAADFAGLDDRVTAITANASFTRAALGSIRFWSERYSRHGEVFAYLKVDGTEGLESSHFDDRADIESAIDSALRPDRRGCVLGSGHGLRYSYIDLALLELGESIPAIKQALVAGGIPRRTWIMFYDREWSDEWVGIYDDTPPPPTVTE